MRSVAILLGITVVASSGCGASGSNPTAPPADSRGTPLGAGGTFGPGSPLLWSAASNEIVGAGGASGQVLAFGELTAMHGWTGLTRKLDADPALAPATGAAGTPIYYMALDFGSGADTVVNVELRRVAIHGGAPERIDACPAFCFYGYSVSADGSSLAWTASGFSGADSMVIERTAGGARTRIAPGVPVLWSPEGSQLLYSSGIVSTNLMLHDLRTGTDKAFDLGLPPAAAPAVLRWDVAGVHVLYLEGSGEVWVRHVATGASERLYATDDTLTTVSAGWSPDGNLAAFWSDGVGGGAGERRRSVHAVSVASGTGSVVATGSVQSSVLGPPGLFGGIAFSPDSRMLAYTYGDQLFTSSVPYPLAGPAARLAPGPATTAGWSAIGPSLGPAASTPLARLSARGRTTPATPAR